MLYGVTYMYVDLVAASAGEGNSMEVIRVRENT